MKKALRILVVLAAVLVLGGSGSALAADEPVPARMVAHPEQVTTAESGAVAVMTVGERFALKLGEAPPDWEIQISDMSVIARVPNITVVRGVQGIYQAKAPGTAVLSAQGTWPCQREQPSCKIMSPLMQITIVVQPQRSSDLTFVIGKAGWKQGSTTAPMAGAAFLEHDRTYVPANDLFAALATQQDGVQYDAATQQWGVTRLDGVSVSVQAGSTVLRLGDSAVQMDVAPVVRDGVLYVPVRWVAEALGYRVSWNQEMQAAHVGQ